MSILVSMLRMKCPKCHKGNLFIKNNPYDLKMLSKMPTKCPVCGQLTEPEPAFYYGAMYFSYFICVPIGFLNYFIFEVGLGLKGVYFLVLNALVLLSLWPVIFRYARVVYIYLFVRFDPKAGKE